MRKVVVCEWMALDGVVQAPGAPDEDTTGGFEHGGWHVLYFDDLSRNWVVENLTGAGGYLLGRRTYESFASYWPKASEEEQVLAQPLNTLPKYVASRTLDRVEWNNSTLLQGDVASEIRKLKDRPGRELQVHGSGGLAQTLIGNDLVDEYRLWSFPVVLGRGKRLFGSGTGPAATFRLVDSRTTSTGVAIHTYARAGDVQHGSVEATEWREKFQHKSGA